MINFLLYLNAGINSVPSSATNKIFMLYYIYFLLGAIVSYSKYKWSEMLTDFGQLL